MNSNNQDHLQLVGDLLKSNTLSENLMSREEANLILYLLKAGIPQSSRKVNEALVITGDLSY